MADLSTQVSKSDELSSFRIFYCDGNGGGVGGVRPSNREYRF